MARPANILRPVHLHTTIPEDLRARMDLHLYSEVEKRVPMGAYQQFICGLVKDFFDGQPKKISPLEIALGRLSSAMGNPAVHWNPKIDETIDSAVVNEAARRFEDVNRTES